MIVEAGKDSLLLYLCNQLRSNFLLNEEEKLLIYNNIDSVLNKIEVCFKSIDRPKYFRKGDEVYFNYLHSSQYCIFLYFFSRTIQFKAEALATKFYLLNKMLNAIDLHYSVDLPDIFFMDHPVGTVIGKANFSNNFSFRQNCTVGNNKGIFPIFGENVRLMANVTVIGNSKIENNVVFSANTFVKDNNIPANSLVFGVSPNLVIKNASAKMINMCSDFI